MMTRSHAAAYPVGLALISAALFGAATPASKALLGSLNPFQLAGMLYLDAAQDISIWTLQTYTVL